MHRAFLLAGIAAFSLTARADPPDADVPATDPPPLRTVHAILVKDTGDHAAKRFSTDTPKIRALWKGEGLKAGDKIHAIWIAEDVGPTAPKESKITEATVTAYKPDSDGAFALGRPKEGWPAGSYRCEIFLNSKLEVTLSFTIEQGVTVEVPVTQESASPAQTSAPLQPDPDPAVQPKQ